MDDALKNELLTNKHRRYMAIALKMSTTANGHHQHGCVIVKGGRILAKGRNDYSNGRHAECNAIGKNWKSEFNGAILYVVRARRDQRYGMSKPCPDCAKAIRSAGIDKVIYSTDSIDCPLAIEKVV